MAKAGRLSSKLRSVLKKMNSIGNTSRKQSQQCHDLSRDSSTLSSSSTSSSSTDLMMEQQGRQLQTVYVGMSRREYHIPTELLDHPVMRDLAIDDGSVIGCEVVLFDHLCWMLDQKSANQMQTIDDDDLAAFYAY